MIEPNALTRADLERFDAAPSRSGSEWRFRCPICQSSQRSLAVNVETGAWHCWRASCGAKGILVERQTKREAVCKRQSIRMRELAKIERMNASAAILEPSEPDHEKERQWRDMAKASLTLMGTPAASYLEGRGISQEVGVDNHLRFCVSWYGRPAVLFPIRDLEGKLVACQGRFLDPKANPKAITGGRVGNGFFSAAGAWPEKKSQHPLVITEAPLDALSLAITGTPAIALCGCALRPWFAPAMALGVALLAFDADDAGDKAAKEWCALLSPFAVLSTRVRPTEAKDWNEMLKQGRSENIKALFEPFQRIKDPFLNCEADLKTLRATPTIQLDLLDS